MKLLFALSFILAICSTSLSKGNPVKDIPEDYMLTDKDFDSLITYATFNLKKTRREAVKDMAKCVYNAGRLGWDLYQLVQVLNIRKIPRIIKRIIKCINTCQSFKYLQMTKECGDRVKDSARNLSNNASLYKLLTDHSGIKYAIAQLRRDLLIMEKVCVADPNTLGVSEICESA